MGGVHPTYYPTLYGQKIPGQGRPARPLSDSEGARAPGKRVSV